MIGLGASIAFIVTVLFLFALRPVAVAIGLVDVPGGRKRHDGPVPVIGGLAMSVGLLFGVSLAGPPAFWTSFALAICLLVVLGTIDDRFDLPAGVRLVAQTCAAMVIVFGADISVAHLGAPLFFDLPLGFLGVPFSLLLIVTVINAFNVIDGLDGLAGGLAFLTFASLSLIGVGSDIAHLATILAAVVAGFLLFNLPLPFTKSVRCFMGDAGSTFLGAAIVTIGIALSQPGSSGMSPVTGLWIVAVPVFDLFCAIIRRLIKGESPFAPDHDHLHHILNANGESRRGGALLLLICMGTVFSGIGLLGHFLQMPDGIMMILWFGAGAFYYQLMRRPAALVRLIRAPQQFVDKRQKKQLPTG